MPHTKFTESQQKEIGEVLASLNLKTSEQKLYLMLLSLGQTTVTPLAKALGSPVTTTQSILQRLVNFGIITVTNRRSRHMYEARDPKYFQQMLTRQMEDVKNIIPLLEQLRGETSNQTKIRVYYGQRMTDIFHDALDCKSKIMYEIISAKDFQEILGEKFHLTNRRVKKGIFLKSLRVEKYEIKKYGADSHTAKLRAVKFLPRELTFRSNIVFWDDSVAFFSNYNEGLACVITSVSMREMVSQLFELLWSISRPM
ncbi:MAG: helix-turn-helix domain-containing protein [bacterium]|nr:helix-turn-helix domain-containing protein [bacterium]